MNYGVLVGEAYTVYWPQDRWRRALSVGRPLEILFGGPHRSAPSFARAKVGPGDVLYPIGVHQQTLLAFGRMRVRTLVTATPQAYLDRCPHWRFLADPSCLNEVVLGEDGTVVLGSRTVPRDVLKRLTYLPRGGPRPVKHINADGRLTHASSVQGIYRLSPESAAALDHLLAGPTDPLPHLAKPAAARPEMDALW